MTAGPPLARAPASLPRRLRPRADRLHPDTRKPGHGQGQGRYEADMVDYGFTAVRDSPATARQGGGPSAALASLVSRLTGRRGT
ncbi:hypothetical protein [Streptomyces sp. NPDC050121]|uniref:hypothetical protein n=1 Tax=Streptomyces sp. NPDC050121 TaxID=3365601 RepID=UPI0037880E59